MHNHVSGQPKLIIICGLIGTGKSTIAREVAGSKGWTIVSSDAVRKKLAKMSATHHEYVAFEKGIYSSEFTAKTYEKMNQIAERILKEGRSVVMDASFARKEYRAKTYALAKSLNAEVTCIELVCTDEEIKRRLTLRMKQEKQISDGRWEIFSQQKASFEDVDDFADEEHIVVDTSNPTKAESVARALKMIDTRGRS
jgi:hypothetical protein